MDLTPCGCGEPRFDHTGAVVILPDGELRREIPLRVRRQRVAG